MPDDLGTCPVCQVPQTLMPLVLSACMQAPDRETAAGQKRASACAQTPDPALQTVVPDKKDRKKRKKGESRDGELNAQNMGQASEAAAPPEKKKRKKRCVKGPKNGDAAGAVK
jgi:hypothetical protein